MGRRKKGMGEREIIEMARGAAPARTPRLARVDIPTTHPSLCTPTLTTTRTGESFAHLSSSRRLSSHAGIYFFVFPPLLRVKRPRYASARSLRRPSPRRQRAPRRPATPSDHRRRRISVLSSSSKRNHPLTPHLILLLHPRPSVLSPASRLAHDTIPPSPRKL